MARRTVLELNEARRAKEAERVAQAAERVAQEAARVERRTQQVIARRKSQDLANALGGLYDEVEKLNRKWPTQPVTALTVKRVNKVLATARELVAGQDDDFLDALDEIVPAGDLPETRDVVLTLREAKDAVERLQNRYSRAWSELEDEDEDEDY